METMGFRPTDKSYN
jgi:pentatricopeptide repeat protein